MTQTVEKIQRLELQLKSLKQQRDASRYEANQWAEKRDTVNKQIKDLRLEAKTVKERRDALNARVSVFKTLRNETRASVKRKLEEIKQLRQKLRNLGVKRPRQDYVALKKQKEEIEWKIQTTSLTLDEERPLVERVNQLQTQLEIYEQMNDVRKKIAELQGQIDSLNTEAKTFHEQLSELAPMSQELHEKMMETIGKAKELAAEADSYHQKFVEGRLKAQESHKECVDLQKRLEAMTRQRAEKEEEEKTREQSKKREELRKAALRKLEQGEKLTLEEFKLLGQEEESA